MDTYLDTLLNKHIKKLKKDKKYIQKETSKIIQEVTNNIILALIADLYKVNQKLNLIFDKIPKKSHNLLESYLSGASYLVNILAKTNKNKSDKDIVFNEAANLRFMTWSILTILELTPNLPWEKFTEYLEKENKNKGQKNNNELHDIMTFYYLDKLEILRGKYNKGKNWNIAKKYLERNVFNKVYIGEKPPKLKTILGSINKSRKVNDQRLRTTNIIDGTGYQTEDGLAKIDLDTLNKMFTTSKMNDTHNVIENINNNKKLYDAFDHLTNKQQFVIKLRYHENLTNEEIAKRLGIDESTVREHEKSAIKNLKKRFLPDIN